MRNLLSVPSYLFRGLRNIVLKYWAHIQCCECRSQAASFKRIEEWYYYVRANRMVGGTWRSSHHAPDTGAWPQRVQVLLTIISWCISYTKISWIIPRETTATFNLCKRNEEWYYYVQANNMAGGTWNTSYHSPDTGEWLQCVQVLLAAIRRGLPSTKISWNHDRTGLNVCGLFCRCFMIFLSTVDLSW